MNIQELIIANEQNLRLSFFFGILILMATWEILAPKRKLTVSKPLRWVNNLGLVFINSLILRLVIPATAVKVALFVADNNWGLLNFYSLPVLPTIIIAIVAMDLVIYLQHVLFHAVPTLWRLHRVHHADMDYDVTTGARFHTIEIIISAVIKFATIVVLGAPVVAVIIFEIVLNAMAMFNHGNVGLPRAFDKTIRFFVVTPDMHRIHHSIEVFETNSNYGFNLSLWDRFFGTYRDQPVSGHSKMTIGLSEFRNVKQTSQIGSMLSMPFWRQ